MTASLLELERVTKRYETTGPPIEVLRGISWTLQRGEAVAVLGPSGSGKTTLLALMGGLDEPTSGTIRFEGEELSRLDGRKRAALRNRRIGLVFQLHHLLPQCTVLENVLVPTLVAESAGRRTARERALQLLDRVGLSGRLHHRPGQLSGGECQRVALVRALIHRPALLLADEPTGSLDRATAEALTDLLLEVHREEGVTLVVATHAETVAQRMQRRVALRDGQLVELER